MRRGLVALTAAIVLLPGCHQYWGTSSSPSSATVTYEPLDGAAQAQANVRSAIPAIEAYYADNGTYAGMTLELVQQRYDAAVREVLFVGPFSRDTYCVESSVGQATYHKQGPAADIQGGHCGEKGAPAQAPPPPSYDPVANVRAAIPAIEAYNADNATYAGMTVKNLRETYDSGIPDVEIVKATNTTYCIESTVSGETFSKHGPTADIVPDAC
jgi:hypothetical protein